MALSFYFASFEGTLDGVVIDSLSLKSTYTSWDCVSAVHTSLTSKGCVPATVGQAAAAAERK